MLQALRVLEAEAGKSLAGLNAVRRIRQRDAEEFSELLLQNCGAHEQLIQTHRDAPLVRMVRDLVGARGFN